MCVCNKGVLNQTVSGTYSLQDALALFVFEVFLLDLEGLVEQLQLGGISLQMDLGSSLVGLPGKHCQEKKKKQERLFSSSDTCSCLRRDVDT